MKQNQKSIKVAFHVGELPATTFINRLAHGLAAAGVQITMYGLIKKKFRKSAGIRYSGAIDDALEGRKSKFYRYIKYGLLLSLFRSDEKRKLNNWLKTKRWIHWGEKSLLYPILWDRPDIIHVQWAKAIDHFGWASHLGIKLIVSFRGAHINYSPLSHPKLADVYKSNFPLVDGFHGVSKAICKEATKYGAEINKCQVVYSGFDLEHFPKSYWVDKRNKPIDQPLQIISIGRSHWKKGYQFSLDTMRILKDINVPFQYTIIGAKDNEELQFQRAQLELEKNVTFLGTVAFDKVKQLISEADLLLLPSVEEGIANVVLEAMALGTIVASTNCGGMAEVIEDEVNGFIVPVREPQAMADKILKYAKLNVIEKEQIINAAYDKIKQQHSNERMVAGMLHLYKTVLND